MNHGAVLLPTLYLAAKANELIVIPDHLELLPTAIQDDYTTNGRQGYGQAGETKVIGRVSEEIRSPL
ncbi:unnamed protein product [Nippostrongylus brasiliensis]|uniref:DNA topoisomerase (ATP-hydrolyzing) n=1 Tax=Nippostrongylus brasiliensis TaxID=27835 RepID=A0A0N4Y1M6_NIPBR|nr:hypothetical protein Q1695_000696 [Nippostrongylus brasiliensis]VDL73121.1 unnamed protein product [Nippostrongylus brasiliensis]